MPKNIQFTLVVIACLLVVGLGSASAPGVPVSAASAFAQVESPLRGWALVQPPGDCWHNLIIHSDPPGARVYGEDGKDWGETTDDSGVRHEFVYYSRNWDCSSTPKYTVTLKKRGYKPTSHTYTQHYFNTEGEAQDHTEDLRITVENQPE